MLFFIAMALIIIKINRVIKKNGISIKIEFNIPDKENFIITIVISNAFK